jgi:8-oxo-dGTP pyrophosphatase MutT (NUDIX family)
MAPFPARTYEPPEGAEYRNSAVLALLIQRTPEAALELTLTVRSSDLKSHSGQISFPGGSCDDGETFEQTALRETHEEIGLPPTSIQLLGALTPLYVPVSTSYIHPIVGFHTGEPDVVLSADEVAEVFYVPLETLTQREAMAWMQREMFGKVWDVPYWNVHPRVPLWGATAMMIRELIALYEEARQHSMP